MHAGRVCIFCGSTPTSAEHLFPAWVGRLFEKKGISGEHSAGTSNRGLLRQWKNNRPLQYVIKVVCRKCNNGWMSDIEKNAIRIISAMITGGANPFNPILLDEEMKNCVSVWLALRAVVFWYFEKGLQELPSSWLNEIKDHGRCPRGWSIWIGANNGVVASHYMEKTSEIEMYDGEKVVVHQGLVMSGNLGHFVFKVLASRESERGMSFRRPEYIARTFPSNHQSCVWLPSSIFDKTSMLNFFEQGWHDTKKSLGQPLIEMD